MRYYIKKPSNNIGKVRSNVTAPWHGTRWLKGLGARLRHAKPCQGISDPPCLVPPCTVPYPRTLAVRFFNEVFSSESSIRSAQVVSFFSFFFFFFSFFSFFIVFSFLYYCISFLTSFDFVKLLHRWHYRYLNLRRTTNLRKVTQAAHQSNQK